MSSKIALLSGGGASEIAGSFHNYIFDGNYDNPLTIDCGGRLFGFSSDVAALTEETENGNDEADWHERMPWPNLDVVPRVRHCILSHGHFDHIGAAPFLAKKHRDIVFFATAPTKELCRFNWNMTVRIAERKKEKPPFTYTDIEFALSRFQEIPMPNELISQIKINEKISFIPIRAGHILGAISCFLLYKDEVIGFHSADISVVDQRTVPGAPKIPLPERRDCLKFMVVDGTRINEMRTSREASEEAFKKKIRNACHGGKSVRVLAFSIGRTQECYELVREACPEAKIWIDGAGCDISELYLEYDSIDPEVKKHFIGSWEHRRRVIHGGPNVVIVPSAMQFGGQSKTYARYGISRRDHLFVNAGWLDPASPEYGFFESERGQVMRFGKETIPRFCDIARFSLSAHWYGSDVLEARERMKTEKSVVVHTDPDRAAEFVARHPCKGFVVGQNEVEIELV